MVALKPGRKPISKSKPERANWPASASPLSPNELLDSLSPPGGEGSVRGRSWRPLTKGKTMRITSDVFTEGGKIPDKYSKYGDNKIPPLHFEAVPERARSLA